MGKAVGGGVYSLEGALPQVTSKSGDKDMSPQTAKIHLESVEFEGHLRPDVWEEVKTALKKIKTDLGPKAPNLTIRIQSRHSKP